MKNGKLLGSEYASFRDDIKKRFKELLKKQRVVMLDPMAGTAPLIPLIESQGHRAYLNDILPLHFFVNQAKTYRMSRHYLDRGHRWFCEKLLDCMSNLQGKRLCISEKWIEDSVLNGLVEAWRLAQKCDELDRILLRAVILLCVRPLSSVTKTNNPTWPKFGGISSNRKLSDIIEDSLKRLEDYYERNYASCCMEVKGECIFLSYSMSELRIPETVDLIITSPPYCNRFDLTTNYGPENYFMSVVGHAVQESNVIGTTKVKDYETFERDCSFLTSESRSARKLFGEMKNSKERDEKTYYLKYYTRYFATLFNSVDRVLGYLSSSGRMFFVTQDNTHRGMLIEIDKILRELLAGAGWKSRVVKKWERQHMGLQNISRGSAFVRPRQVEKLVVVWR